MRAKGLPQLWLVKREELGGGGGREGGNKGSFLPPECLSKTFHHNNHLLPFLGIFFTVVFVQPHTPLLKLKVQVWENQNSHGKIPTWIPFPKTTVTKICIPKQTYQVVASPWLVQQGVLAVRKSWWPWTFLVCKIWSPTPTPCPQGTGVEARAPAMGDLLDQLQALIVPGPA